MPNYIWFIIGILFWQLIFLIVALATHENEEVMAYFGIGFWVIPIFILGKSYRTVRFWYIKHNYNGYRFVCKGETCGLIYVSNRAIKKFNLNEDAEYHLKMCSVGKYWKSAPYNTEIYKGQKYFNGWDMSKFKKSNE